MLISPHNAAKLLNIDKKILLKKIRMRQITVYSGVNGVKQILLSQAQRIAKKYQDELSNRGAYI